MRKVLAMSAAARPDISEVRKAWREANLAPLWENTKAHRPAPAPDAAYLWSWDKIRPLISAAIAVASPEVVERRVLQLVPPIPKHQDEQQTSRTLAANIQILLPGEKARPHRHTMNDRGLGSDHDRGRQALSNGGGRSHSHAGGHLA
jgi:gentisate 1,2-dioxygenase